MVAVVEVLDTDVVEDDLAAFGALAPQPASAAAIATVTTPVATHFLTI